jgi:hypothetical protein
MRILESKIKNPTSQPTNLINFGPDIAGIGKSFASKAQTLQRLLNIALDVAIMATIVASFFWGGYASKTGEVAVKPAHASARY